jgi:hypothetical protein
MHQHHFIELSGHLINFALVKEVTRISSHEGEKDEEGVYFFFSINYYDDTSRKVYRKNRDELQQIYDLLVHLLEVKRDGVEE